MQLQGYLQKFYACIKFASTSNIIFDEMVFRQCDQLFNVIGLNDLCYLAKGIPRKDFLSTMHRSFSCGSISIVDDVQDVMQTHQEMDSLGTP